MMAIKRTIRNYYPQQSTTFKLCLCESKRIPRTKTKRIYGRVENSIRLTK